MRHLLLPTWPPLSVSEALIYVLVAVALRVLLDIWLPLGPVLPLFDNPADQALMLLGQGLRWAVMALVFGLVTRIILKLDPVVALAAGALVLLSLCLEPVIERIWSDLSFYRTVGVMGLIAALSALAIGAFLSRGPLRIALFAVATGIVAAAGLTYMQRHAWLLDFSGFAVKGALIADRDEARRVFLLHLLPLMVFSVGWLVMGGSRARTAWYAVTREWWWPVFGFVALAALGGWIAAAVAESAALQAWLPSLFLPPAVYGVLGEIMALALLSTVAASIRGRLRRRSSILGAGDLVAMVAIAIVIGLGVAPISLVALGAFFAVLLFLTWPMEGIRRSMPLGLVGGGLLSLSAFWAGALAMPQLDLANFVAEPLVVAVVFAAGMAVAGLVRLVDEAAGRRPQATQRMRATAVLWLVDLGAALCILAMLMGSDGLLTLAVSSVITLIAIGAATLVVPGRRMTLAAVFVLAGTAATVGVTVVDLLT